MRSLNAIGISIGVDGSRLFVEGTELRPNVRKLAELRGVLLDPQIVDEGNKEDPLYYMFRGVGCSVGDSFSKADLRYDITVIEEYGLGRELNKTLGHYHPIAEKNLAYPELYEVIEGNALFLFQKRLRDSSYDVRLVHAKPGDKVIVPPNYGHITINAGKGLLYLANIWNASAVSDYKSIIDMGGGAVYVISGMETVPNRRYKDSKVSVMKTPPRTDFDGKASIYDQFLAGPAKFEFLNRPSLVSWD